MKYLISVLFLLITLTSISQGGLVKRSYYHCVVESPSRPDIQGSYKIKTTFVYNPYSLPSLLHIRADGKRVLYIRVSGIGESDVNEVGYSFFWAIDERDRKILIQVFDNEDMGVSIFTDTDIVDGHTAFHFFNRKAKVHEKL